MLQIANLEVVYHQVVRVLQGVSLAVEPGQIVALLGPNGAGKTSTLRAITGLLDIHDGRMTKGQIQFLGEEIGGASAEKIVSMGMAQVMEGRRILAELTVEENLIAGGWSAPRGRLQSDLERYYGMFPILGERRKQLAGYLSGGEQQMLAIARALMSRPRLLLLDEPSLGLAPRIVQEVASLIRTINQEDGVSILLVEQNASMALALADHGYILENGRMVLDGTAASLTEDEDIREFYLGMSGDAVSSYRDVKRYRRRKRWLS